MKTDQEILERIKEVKAWDGLFGFEAADLIGYLSYESAKPFLEPEATPEEWNSPTSQDRDKILADMLEYMPFAWEKANDCRGISAARTMAHYSAWVWIIGDDLGPLHQYEYYGKDNLRKICEKYGWNADQWDDGVRTNG